MRKVHRPAPRASDAQLGVQADGLRPPLNYALDEIFKEERMALKCNNKEMLLDFVRNKHPQAVFSHPSALQTKIDFPCGLVMNVFNTGTVNFQGNSFENHTATDIVNVIEAINR